MTHPKFPIGVMVSLTKQGIKRTLVVSYFIAATIVSFNIDDCCKNIHILEYATISYDIRV